MTIPEHEQPIEPSVKPQSGPAPREVAGPPALEAGEPGSGGVHARLRAKVAATVADLRFVTSPPSLRDHLAYARVGEWTEEIDGYRRHLALVYAWAVAIPVSTLAYAIAWAAARPGRCASTLAVTLLVNTALNEIPIVDLLIPDWATLPYWPPVSWIF